MATIIASGDWWTLDSDGVLNVFCVGDMPLEDTGSEPAPPWVYHDGEWLAEQITSVRFADTVTSIGYGAFYECIRLTDVEIPADITEIGSYAFYVCQNLASVTIPDSVTQIGECAFGYCEALTDVYYTGTEQQWNAITIGEDNDYLTGATIHYNYAPPEPEPAVTPKIAYTGQSKVIKRLCELVSGLYAAPRLVMDSGGYICVDYGGSDNGD